MSGCRCPWCRRLPEQMKRIDEYERPPLSPNAQAILNRLARKAARKVKQPHKPTSESEVKQ